MKNNQCLPDGFVYLASIVDGIEESIPYASKDNFLGQQVDGYLAAKAILTHQAANALAQAQQSVIEQGFYLRIFDAYRPVQAVKHFLRWIHEDESLERKQHFYPDFTKAELFEKGYLATHSSHSRGSTVDLTLVSQDTGKELDMGTAFDFFGEASWLSYQNLSTQQYNNRQYLQKIMLQNGFQAFELEWWHFTLLNEPFPKQSFDFPVA